jgi:hypothetical protein
MPTNSKQSSFAYPPPAVHRDQLGLLRAQGFFMRAAFGLAGHQRGQHHI